MSRLLIRFTSAAGIAVLSACCGGIVWMGSALAAADLYIKDTPTDTVNGGVKRYQIAREKCTS